MARNRPELNNVSMNILIKIKLYKNIKKTSYKNKKIQKVFYRI